MFDMGNPMWAALNWWGKDTTMKIRFIHGNKKDEFSYKGGDVFGIGLVQRPPSAYKSDKYLKSMLKFTMMKDDMDDDFNKWQTTADGHEDLVGLSHTTVGAGGLN